jgi:hypothetical protein
MEQRIEVSGRAFDQKDIDSKAAERSDIFQTVNVVVMERSVESRHVRTSTNHNA